MFFAEIRRQNPGQQFMLPEQPTIQEALGTLAQVSGAFSFTIFEVTNQTEGRKEITPRLDGSMY